MSDWPTMLDCWRRVNFLQELEELGDGRDVLPIPANVMQLRRIFPCCREIPKETSRLPPRCKDHALAGDGNRYRDCHIGPDWLLIYKTDGDDLYVVRSGKHSDLF